MRVNLATSETLTTEYNGEWAGRYISAALLSPDSIENGAVSPIDGIKFKWSIPKMTLSGIVQDDSCDFTPTGTVSTVDQVLTTKDLKINLKLCKSKYRKMWESLAMGVTNHDKLPPKFEDYFMELVVMNLAQHMEETIWDGVSTNDGEFTGFETLLTTNAAQPAAMEVTGTTLTAANILAEIGKVFDAAPTAVYKAPGFGIRIPVTAEKFFLQAQAALGYRDLYYDDKSRLNYLGVPLVTCSGLSDNKMVATYEDNLWIGYASAGDQSNVKLIDQSEVDGSDNVHVIMKFNAGAQYGSGEDIVTYGITNGSN